MLVFCFPFKSKYTIFGTIMLKCINFFGAFNVNKSIPPYCKIARKGSYFFLILSKVLSIYCTKLKKEKCLYNIHTRLVGHFLDEV